jgi:DNA-binding transcriptional LysR family regulator
MRINFETADIEAFAAVGTLLSFKEAANQLNISASALGRRVQKLEEQLGARLLERTTRQVKLTLAGKQLLARAQELLASVDELALSLTGGSGPKMASISIACIPSIAHRLLPAALQAFHARHPTTRVIIRDLTTNEVVDAVTRGDADFGITSFVQADTGLDFQPLIRGHVMAVMPHGHPLEKKKRVTWSDLAQHDVIATWKEAGIRMVMDVHLAKEQERVTPFYEVRQMDTALKFVEAGLGVAPIPSFLLSAGDHQALTVLPLTEPTIPIDLGTVIARNHQLRPQAKDMISALANSVFKKPRD